ncbi:MAG: hypothetical protein IKN89_03815 [Oscillospiraceae bacterium]|nr:hypothetical protein [Oscillospiraceae bacterium]
MLILSGNPKVPKAQNIVTVFLISLRHTARVTDDETTAHVLSAYLPPDFVEKSCNTLSIPAIFYLHQAKNPLENPHAPIELSVT